MEGLGTDGKWGGICQKDFDINDAHVICRMLGYPNGALKAWKGTNEPELAHNFGLSTSGKFILDDLNCNGDETSVADCSYKNTLGSHDCVEETEIAGIKCQL